MRSISGGKAHLHLHDPSMLKSAGLRGGEIEHNVLWFGSSPDATPNSAQIPLQVGLKTAALENR
jgi:hypothetical protein